MAATLSKQERLSGKRDIQNLMDSGKWGHGSHMRYCCIKDNGTDINRILISVPKRYFKRAVKRNLLKRRIREAYRTQKDLLAETGTDIMFCYTSKEVCNFAELKEEVADILKKIA